MKKPLLLPAVIALVLALVAGCDRQQVDAPAVPEPAVADRRSDDAPSVGPVAAPEVDVPAVVAAALVGSADAVLRYDWVRDLPGDEGRQRQVFLEVIDVPAEQAESRVLELLAEQGYSSARRSDGEGRARHSMVKRGSPSLSVLIRSREAGPPLKNAGALSSIYITTRAD